MTQTGLQRMAGDEKRRGGWSPGKTWVATFSEVAKPPREAVDRKGIYPEVGLGTVVSQWGLPTIRTALLLPNAKEFDIAVLTITPVRA